jgi:predicted permease
MRYRVFDKEIGFHLFIGVSAIALGGILSLILARFFKLPNPQTGSLFVCGAFTNIGSVGALVCFIAQLRV